MAEEEWQTAIEARLRELAAAVDALWMEPPRDQTMQELPYHVNTLMRRAVMEFEAAFDRALRYPGQWTEESRTRLEAAYSLWNDQAADFAASLAKLQLAKDYFAACKMVFPGGQARESIADVIERMEELAPTQSAFGGSRVSVSRDYLNLVEVLTECGLMNDGAALRRLNEKVYGRTETTAEALAQLELELEGAVMLGEARRKEFALGILFQSGQVEKSGFALEVLSAPEEGPNVYGLIYPGHFARPSWCYLTIGEGVMIASQPSNGDCGTSLTNVWSEEFIAMMEEFLREEGALPAAGEVDRFEHYIDWPEEMDRVWLNPEADVEWSGVARGQSSVREAFEALVGPMPAFESFSFGAVFDRVRAELTKESRQSELNREVERCRRACGPIDAGLAPGGGESRVREIGR
jgi:hypothetical protein